MNIWKVGTSQRQRKNKLTYFDIYSTQPMFTSVKLLVSCWLSASALVSFSVASQIPSSELQRTRHILQESYVLQSPGKMSPYSKRGRGCCQDSVLMRHFIVVSRKTQTTVISQYTSHLSFCLYKKHKLISIFQFTSQFSLYQPFSPSSCRPISVASILSFCQFQNLPECAECPSITPSLVVLVTLSWSPALWNLLFLALTTFCQLHLTGIFVYQIYRKDGTQSICFHTTLMRQVLFMHSLMANDVIWIQ
jgi:hypothetical protein